MQKKLKNISLISLHFKNLCLVLLLRELYTIIQGDSLARGPTEVYLQIFNDSVNQLMDDEPTTGYYQQDGATCHISNASMREVESFFKDRIVSKNFWPPRSPDLTPVDFFLWGLLKSKVYKNTPPHNRTTQRRYKPRDWSRQRRHFGNSIPEFGEMLSNVLGCERRPFSAPIMSRSCFTLFPVFVYKFSSHYLIHKRFNRQ